MLERRRSLMCFFVDLSGEGLTRSLPSHFSRAAERALSTLARAVMRLLVIAVLIALASGCTLDDRGSSTPEGGSTVVVPDVTRSTASDAFARLREAGVRIRVATGFRLASNRDPIVAGQRPDAGTRVTPGTTVVVRLVSGPVGLLSASEHEVRVPDVTGLSLRQAVARLQDVGLAWDAGMVPPLASSDAAALLDAYRVTAQKPDGGTRYQQISRHDINGEVEVTIEPVTLDVRSGEGT